MKRHAFMVVCTFAVLLLALLVYQWVTTGKIGFNIRRSHVADDSAVAGGKSIRGPAFPHPGKQLYMEDRKPDGHLDAIYQAAQWEKLSETSYKLIEPKIQMFTRAGTQVIVTANEGFVEAQELTKGENLRHGSLRGDVKIIYDPATGLGRTPWEQRPDEVVRILVDRISFDNDRLMISTDSEVEVYSPQADMLGKGLLLSWNEAPQELAELRIDHGRMIVIKKMPTELTPSLPTGSDAAATDKLPLAAAPAAQPATATTLPKGVPPHKPPQKPAQNIMVAELIGSEKLIDVDHGAQSVHGAKRLSFQFEWDQSKGRSGVLGTTSKPAGAAGSRTAGAPPVAPAVATTQPAQEPMVITWEGPLVIKPAGYTAAPSNKNYIVRGEGEDVHLNDIGAKATCSKFDMASPQQDAHLYGTDAKPAHMELASGEIIDCLAMHYYHKGEKENRIGVADLSGPGVMTRRATRVAGTASVVGESVVVAATTLPAPTTSPGEQDRITWTKSVQAIFVADSTDKTTARPAAGSPMAFGARTKEHLSEAIFEGGVHLLQSAAGDYLNSDHLHVTMGRNKHGQSYPTVAVVSGNVTGRFRSTDNPQHPQVIAFSSQEGTLNFKEDTSPQAKTPAQPSIFEARKDVTFTYGPEVEGKADTPVIGKADSMTGDVAAHTAVLYGKPASLAQGANILRGEQIELDQYSGAALAPKTVRKPGPSAHVYGRGSLDFESDRDMNGNQLTKVRPIQVTWTKSMAYDGNIKPEVVTQGDRTVVLTARATFTGDVIFNSEPKVIAEHEEHGQDHLQSQQMDIWFAEKALTAGPRTATPAVAVLLPAPAGPVPASPVALSAATSPAPVAAATSRPATGMDMQFSSRAVVRMTAQKQVVLSSSRMLKDERPDQADRGIEFLLRRVEVTGDNLLYDAITNEVNMLGAGDIVVEDYRQPAVATAGKDKEKAQISADSAQLQPPYQFWSTWKDSMVIDQNARTVTLKGRVAGGYRGGAQMLLKDSIKMQPGPKLPAGQIFAGTCEKMVAQFYAPQATGAKSANFDEGPRLGPPRSIDASGKVNMTVDATGKPKLAGETPEPTWQIFGDQIHYERPADAKGNPILDQPAIAFVEALPDANGQYRNAQVVHQDKKNGVSDDCIAPRIDMTIKDGEIIKVEAKKITGVR